MIRKEYQESLISQMDSLKEGQFFTFYINSIDYYLIVKLRGKIERG